MRLKRSWLWRRFNLKTDIGAVDVASVAACAGVAAWFVLGPTVGAVRLSVWVAGAVLWGRGVGDESRPNAYVRCCSSRSSSFCPRKIGWPCALRATMALGPTPTLALSGIGDALRLSAGPGDEDNIECPCRSWFIGVDPKRRGAKRDSVSVRRARSFSRCCLSASALAIS